MSERHERQQRVAAQNQEDPVVVVDENDDTFEEHSCIDLTEDDTYEVIDLSSPRNGPTVLIENIDDDVPRREGRWRGRLRVTSLRPDSQTSEQEAIRIEDDSSEELPEVDIGRGTSYVSDSPINQSGATSQAGVCCPICFDSLQQIQRTGRQLMSTNCGHVFCSECIQTCLAQHSPTCPTCRKRVTRKQLRPLFL